MSPERADEIMAMDDSREAFEAWWYASKYAQVVIPSQPAMQVAWDGWQAATERLREALHRRSTPRRCRTG